MAQGQAISVLIRAYWHSGEQHFLEAARLAACALILPLEEGGCGTIEMCIRDRLHWAMPVQVMLTPKAKVEP